MTEEPVDPVTGRVYEVLERTLRCFGPAREHVTVVGGLAPSLLVPVPSGERHVGTADVDLCLTVALADGHTGYYDEVTAALRKSGFQQSANPRQRFRWGRVGIVVDFLYPADDGERPLRKTRAGETWETSALRSLGEDFAALAVPFRHLIEATREPVEFTAVVDGGRIPNARAFVAGPAALAALKAFALSSRTKWKDAYDPVWVLDERGPEAAALDSVVRVEGHKPAATELREAVDLLDELFGEGCVGPAWYANFVLGDRIEDDLARRQHERFALETVAAFTSSVRSRLS